MLAKEKKETAAKSFVSLRGRVEGTSSRNVAVFNMRGNVTYANDIFVKTWGYCHRHEVVHQPAERLWEKIEDFNAFIESMTFMGKWTGILTGSRKNGSIFEVLVSARQISDKQGQPFRIIASFIEIGDETLTK